jgi:pyridine nucleotide-disulfide oxidoreductase family protein
MAARLVLVGAGHAHAEVLRRFAQQPAPDVDLLLVSPIAQVPYSGMMPGWLGGRYSWEECCVDFAALAAAAGARWVQDEVVALNAAQRLLVLASGKTLRADFVALNIGSTVLTPRSIPGQPLILPTRPLTALRVHTEHLLSTLSSRQAQAPLRLVGVGAGAAGFEMLLGLQARLTAQGVTAQSTLTTRSGSFLPGLSVPARRLARCTLQQHRVRLQLGFDAARLCTGAVLDAKGNALAADVVLWATGGVAHAWPAQSGLAVDASGFLQVDATLRSISHPWLFAVGDCACFTPLAVPKSGVYSVRMGPVLADNLHAMLRGQPLSTYQPQPRFLVLLNTGDGHAIASRGALGWRGRWVMRWKDRIDRKFLGRYR